MSYSAQGWAQREVFGSPILKAVMQALCYLMRDDDLTVYCAVKGGEKVDLEVLTEYEERAIRKALRDLVELGFLQDTGERRRNMIVWRMPRYEAWLTRAELTTPPQNGRGRDSEQIAPAQASENTTEKSGEAGSVHDPSRAGEGFSRGTATPPVQGSDPSRPGSATPPVQGRESSLDLRSTKPARAMREWKAKARVLQERAPDKSSRDTPPGTPLKAHWRFWIQMVEFYGNLWLVQWGETPTSEFVRVLNLWNSGKWAELDELLKDLVLEKPATPGACTAAAIDAIFRKRSKAAGPVYSEIDSRRWWANFILTHITSTAHLYGLAKYGATKIEDVDERVRDKLIETCKELLEQTIAGETQKPVPVSRRDLEQTITDKLNSVMQDKRAPTPAERAFVANDFDEVEFV
jgi:hypothetical protein